MLRLLIQKYMESTVAYHPPCSTDLAIVIISDTSQPPKLLSIIFRSNCPPLIRIIKSNGPYNPNWDFQNTSSGDRVALLWTNLLHANSTSLITSPSLSSSKQFVITNVIEIRPDYHILWWWCRKHVSMYCWTNYLKTLLQVVGT